MKTLDLKNSISITDTAKLLGISRQAAWKLWQHGKFTGKKWGREVILDRKSVEEFVRAYKRVHSRSEKSN